MADFQKQVKAGDREKVADLITFPLRVNRKKGFRMVKSRADLLKDFGTIFTREVEGAILAADPRRVFCNAQGLMLGDGVVWADKDANGTYGVFAINQ